MIFLNSNTIEIQIILEYQSAYATPNHKQSLQIGLDVLLLKYSRMAKNLKSHFISPFMTNFFKHDKGCNEIQPNVNPFNKSVPNVVTSRRINWFPQMYIDKLYRRSINITICIVKIIMKYFSLRRFMKFYGQE